jgi:DNA-binding IclR family transcriptional regulator
MAAPRAHPPRTTPVGRGIQPDKPAAPVVRTLAKALDVLEAVSDSGGLSVAGIASIVGLNRTTTHRLVQALAQAGYLQASENGRGYDVGLRVLPLAARHLDNNRVRLAALPYLNSLAQQTGERVNLGILFDGELLYLAGVEKPSLPNVYSRFGKLAPVHCCSLGKAILAHLSKDEQSAIIEQRPLSRHTANTIVDPEALVGELAEIRRRGYATDDQEHIDNVWCVAAPIFDGGRATAAVGVSGGNRDKVFGMADDVRHAAEIISHILSPARSAG